MYTEHHHFTPGQGWHNANQPSAAAARTPHEIGPSAADNYTPPSDWRDPVFKYNIQAFP